MDKESKDLIFKDKTMSSLPSFRIPFWIGIAFWLCAGALFLRINPLEIKVDYYDVFLVVGLLSALNLLFLWKGVASLLRLVSDKDRSTFSSEDKGGSSSLGVMGWFLAKFLSLGFLLVSVYLGMKQQAQIEVFLGLGVWLWIPAVTAGWMAMRNSRASCQSRV